MRLHPPELIDKFFSLLDSSGIDWILLRNTNDELPKLLDVNKDIDILVRPENKTEIHAFFIANQFMEIRHPLANDIRLYGVDAFRMYKNLEGLLIDVNFQAVVKSLDQGQWIPLDQAIQKELWLNRRFVLIGDEHVPMPSVEDLFVLTLCRCILDKKNFTVWGRALLGQAIAECDIERLRKKLELVFFKFTPRLIDLVWNSKFDEIVPCYLSFSDY